MEAMMRKVSVFFLAAAAVILFWGASGARDTVQPAVILPGKTQAAIVPQALAASTTAQVRISPAGYTDYDAFSSVNDPLFRESSKELLKQVIKDDAAVKPAPKPELRDAPISKGAKSGKRLKLNNIKKPVHADPVKVKNSL
jgi:hypothetical protein